MMKSKGIDRFLPYILLALFFLVSFAARPLLPVDETRYLSVAWEMYLQKNFLVPSLNFAPYFQKPPLLFWLIDLAWSVFGVSRFVALGVVFCISALVVCLIQRLGKAMFPDQAGMSERTPWLTLGSVVFVVYATLVLFDLLLTACVLAFVLALLAFASGRGRRYAALAGLFLGLGVLTKGPVMLIHIACPVLLYSLWRDPAVHLPTRRFFAGMGVLLLTAFVVIMAWLGPALYRMGYDFAYDLVWRQAAGRVAGNLESAHARPVYFYILMLPVAVLPWVLSVDFWQAKPWHRLRTGIGLPLQDLRYLRFLALWFAIVFVVFSLISGKQPHYLMPLLPSLILMFGYFAAKAPINRIRGGALIVLALFSIGQLVAAFIVLPRYNLTSLANFVAGRQDAEWGFVGRYQGEINFLARLSKPIVFVEEDAAEKWLAAHPDAFLIAKANRYADINRNGEFSQIVAGGYRIMTANPQALPKS